MFLNKGKMTRQNKSLADIQSFFGKSKEDKLKDNYKEILDKVQKASSLLRSRSSERNGSLVRQYEIASKRNQFLKTQNQNLTLSKLNNTSSLNLLNQTISTRNLSPNNHTYGYANSLNFLKSGEKCFGSFIRSPKNATCNKERSNSPRSKSPGPQIGPKFTGNSRNLIMSKQIMQNCKESEVDTISHNLINKNTSEKELVEGQKKQTDSLHKFNPSLVSIESSNFNIQTVEYEKLKKRYTELKTKHK